MLTKVCLLKRILKEIQFLINVINDNSEFFEVAELFFFLLIEILRNTLVIL